MFARVLDSRKIVAHKPLRVKDAHDTWKRDHA